MRAGLDVDRIFDSVKKRRSFGYLPVNLDPEAGGQYPLPSKDDECLGGKGLWGNSRKAGQILGRRKSGMFGSWNW